MILNTELDTSATTMSGGVASSAGQGEEYTISFGGTWAIGDKYTFVFTDGTTGAQVQVGAGNISGLAATFCLSYGNKVYLLAGPTVYFSAVGEPTIFNDPNGVFNGFVTMTDWFSTAEDLVAIAPYQGRLAFFSRNVTQIWKVDADPASWAQIQVLEDIGTISPLTVKAIGDLDVMFLHDTGFRNLRPRDSSLNAFVDDAGSPIDLIIQGLNLSDSDKQAACGVVEPTSNRYWGFIKDTIYVYSRFPSSKVAAWSRYDATYESAGVQTAFTPNKFVVFKGQVYARDTLAIYQYGGTDNNTYDNVVATVKTPFLNLKTPGTRKTARGVGVAMTGAWTIKAGMDSISQILDTVYVNTGQSFDQGIIPWSSQGTHIQFQAQTSGSTAAKLSEFILHYAGADEQ